MNWAALATLAVVIVVYAGIHWLRRRGLSFTSATLIALGAGIPIGLLAGQNVEYIDPIGKIYINVLLACVAPLVFVAIVSSVTSLGSLEKLRSIGVRSIFWLLLSNAFAVVLALGLGLALRPGAGLHDRLGSEATSVIENSVQNFTQTFISFFPTNIAENFRGNDIVPIIIVALVLSIAYLSVAERKPEAVRSRRDGAEAVRPFRDVIEALKLVIFKVVGYVVRLTPYAVVALTATTIGMSSNLGKQFWSLLGLLALTWAACFFHAFVFNGVLVRAFADVSPIAFFRKIFPAQLTAFSTQSSVGTLPVTTEQLTRKVGVHPEVAYFTAPLGTTIGMPGCSGIWPILIAVWGINAYDIPYTAGDYVMLAILGVVVSVGTAGVPGAATVAAATVLTAAGLPLEFVAVTLPISTIADMARTMTNVTAAAASATVVARQTGLLDDDIFAGRAEFIDEDELVSGLESDPPAAGPVEEPVDGRELVGAR